MVSVTRSSSYSYAPHLLYASEADYSEPNVEEPDPEPEPKVDDESEPGPEVVELMSPQEEIFSRLITVEELPIETLVDSLAELLWR